MYLFRPRLLRLLLLLLLPLAHPVRNLDCFA